MSEWDAEDAWKQGLEGLLHLQQLQQAQWQSMSSELQSIRALLLQQAQYGGPGWQSPRAPAQNKRPQRPGHQRSFLPRSLLADLSWVDDPDVQGAIQDLSLQFAAEPRRPQPIAEGKDNPVRSSSQVTVVEEEARDGDMEAPAPTARQPNQRPNSASASTSMRSGVSNTAPALPQVDKAQLIQSMLNRPKMSFREIVHMQRMRSLNHRQQAAEDQGHSSLPSSDWGGGSSSAAGPPQLVRASTGVRPTPSYAHGSSSEAAGHTMPGVMDSPGRPHELAVGSSVTSASTGVSSSGAPSPGGPGHTGRVGSGSAVGMRTGGKLQGAVALVIAQQQQQKRALQQASAPAAAAAGASAHVSTNASRGSMPSAREVSGNGAPPALRTSSMEGPATERGSNTSSSRGTPSSCPPPSLPLSGSGSMATITAGTVPAGISAQGSAATIPSVTAAAAARGMGTSEPGTDPYRKSGSQASLPLLPAAGRSGGGAAAGRQNPGLGFEQDRGDGSSQQTEESSGEGRAAAAGAPGGTRVLAQVDSLQHWHSDGGAPGWGEGLPGAGPSSHRRRGSSQQLTSNQEEQEEGAAAAAGEQGAELNISAPGPASGSGAGQQGEQVPSTSGDVDGGADTQGLYMQPNSITTAGANLGNYGRTGQQQQQQPPLDPGAGMVVHSSHSVSHHSSGLHARNPSAGQAATAAAQQQGWANATTGYGGEYSTHNHNAPASSYSLQVSDDSYKKPAKASQLASMTSLNRKRKLQRPTWLAFRYNGKRHDVGRALLYLFWDVWAPSDGIRICWDLWMLVLLAYVIVLVPYIIAFNINTEDLTNVMAIIDLSVNGCFLLDVAFNFRTAFPNDDGVLVHERSKIAVHYLSGWFWLDLFSSLPYDLMFGSDYGLLKLLRVTRILRILRVLRVLRMLKLLRLLRMRSFLTILEEFFGGTVMRMVMFGVTALILLHWAACTFYFTANLYPSDTETWITKFLGDRDPTTGALLGVTEDYVTRYVASLYWAVTTMATVGYGDIVAITDAERVIAMAVMLLGASIFGYFMGSMATIVAALNSSSARISRKKAAVEDFIKHRRIPKRLSDKIKEYYSYIIAREVHTDEADIIAGLSTSLRTRVILHLYREALEKVPFFRGKHPQFITTLVTYLKLEYYTPGDVVMRQGDMGNEMYFIGEGSVEVRVYDEFSDGARPAAPAGADASQQPAKRARGWLAKRREQKRLAKEAEAMQHLNEDLSGIPYKLIGTLTAGQYFGEFSCMLGEPRIATIVTTSLCELYSLSRADLEQVVAEWPDLAEELSALVQDNTMEADAWSVREEMGLPLRRYSANPVAGVASMDSQLLSASPFNRSSLRAYSGAAAQGGGEDEEGMHDQMPVEDAMAAGAGMGGPGFPDSSTWGYSDSGPHMHLQGSAGTAGAYINAWGVPSTSAWGVTAGVPGRAASLGLGAEGEAGGAERNSGGARQRVNLREVGTSRLQMQSNGVLTSQATGLTTCDSTLANLPQGLPCLVEPSSRQASAIMRNMMATVEEEGGEADSSGAAGSQKGSSQQLDTPAQQGASQHPFLAQTATTADTGSLVSPSHASPHSLPSEGAAALGAGTEAGNGSAGAAGFTTSQPGPAQLQPGTSLGLGGDVLTASLPESHPLLVHSVLGTGEMGTFTGEGTFTLHHGSPHHHHLHQHHPLRASSLNRSGATELLHVTAASTDNMPSTFGPRPNMQPLVVPYMHCDSYGRRSLGTPTSPNSMAAITRSPSGMWSEAAGAVGAVGDEGGTSGVRHTYPHTLPLHLDPSASLPPYLVRDGEFSGDLSAGMPAVRNKSALPVLGTSGGGGAAYALAGTGPSGPEDRASTGGGGSNMLSKVAAFMRLGSYPSPRGTGMRSMSGIATSTNTSGAGGPVLPPPPIAVVSQQQQMLPQRMDSEGYAGVSSAAITAAAGAGAGGHSCTSPFHVRTSHASSHAGPTSGSSTPTHAGMASGMLPFGRAAAASVTGNSATPLSPTSGGPLGANPVSFLRPIIGGGGGGSGSSRGILPHRSRGGIPRKSGMSFGDSSDAGHVTMGGGASAFSHHAGAGHYGHSHGGSLGGGGGIGGYLRRLNVGEGGVSADSKGALRLAAAGLLQDRAAASAPGVGSDSSVGHSMTGSAGGALPAAAAAASASTGGGPLGSVALQPVVGPVATGPDMLLPPAAVPSQQPVSFMRAVLQRQAQQYQGSATSLVSVADGGVPLSPQLQGPSGPISTHHSSGIPSPLALGLSTASTPSTLTPSGSMGAHGAGAHVEAAAAQAVAAAEARGVGAAPTGGMTGGPASAAPSATPAPTRSPARSGPSSGGSRDAGAPVQEGAAAGGNAVHQDGAFAGAPSSTGALTVEGRRASRLQVQTRPSGQHQQATAQPRPPTWPPASSGPSSANNVQQQQQQQPQPQHPTLAGMPSHSSSHNDSSVSGSMHTFAPNSGPALDTHRSGGSASSTSPQRLLFGAASAGQQQQQQQQWSAARTSAGALGAVGGSHGAGSSHPPAHHSQPVDILPDGPAHNHGLQHGHSMGLPTAMGGGGGTTSSADAHHQAASRPAAPAQARFRPSIDSLPTQAPSGLAPHQATTSMPAATAAELEAYLATIVQQQAALQQQLVIAQRQLHAMHQQPAAAAAAGGGGSTGHPPTAFAIGPAMNTLRPALGLPTSGASHMSTPGHPAAAPTVPVPTASHPGFSSLPAGMSFAYLVGGGGAGGGGGGGGAAPQGLVAGSGRLANAGNNAHSPPRRLRRASFITLAPPPHGGSGGVSLGGGGGDALALAAAQHQQQQGGGGGHMVGASGGSVTRPRALPRRSPSMLGAFEPSGTTSSGANALPGTSTGGPGSKTMFQTLGSRATAGSFSGVALARGGSGNLYKSGLLPGNNSGGDVTPPDLEHSHSGPFGAPQHSAVLGPPPQVSGAAAGYGSVPASPLLTQQLQQRRSIGEAPQAHGPAGGRDPLDKVRAAMLQRLQGGGSVGSSAPQQQLPQQGAGAGSTGRMPFSRATAD